MTCGDATAPYRCWRRMRPLLLAIAALIIEIRAHQRLGAGHRHIKPSVMIGRGGAQVIQSGADLRFPEQFAVLRIERVSSGGAGDEEDRVCGFPRVARRSARRWERTGQTYQPGRPSKRSPFWRPANIRRRCHFPRRLCRMPRRAANTCSCRRESPKAHLSFSLGTSAAVSPAAAFGLKARVACSSPPRPNGRCVQTGRVRDSPGMCSSVPSERPPILRPAVARAALVGNPRIVQEQW